MFSVAIIGSGPAGLMAARALTALAKPADSISITIFEKRKAPARKLLIAGSSGLNITNSLPAEEFHSQFTGPSELWKKVLSTYPPERWLADIGNLGSETFLGTSGRYFVREMKASTLLRSWLHSLESSLRVQLKMNSEITEIVQMPGETILLHTQDGEEHLFDAAIFCLGGASWEPQESPLRWVSVFEDHGIEMIPFQAANVGYHVTWNEAFLSEAEGVALKNVIFKSKKGEKKGDIMITQYGVEGTPIYTFGETGKCEIDLKPELTSTEIYKKMIAVKENLIPLRRAKKTLNLGPAALALLYHFTPEEQKHDIPKFIEYLKHYPIKLGKPRPLTEAISSSGGIAFSEVGSNLMLTKIPGVFIAGEMLDWTAPTGGFLIQGCVSLGYYAAKCCLGYLKKQ